MMRPMGEGCARYCSKSVGPQGLPQVRQGRRQELQDVPVGVDHRVVEPVADLL